MEAWFDGHGADGFNIMPPYLPGGLTDFIEGVLPELRRRGRFREDYEGTTLRENLGLPFPPIHAPVSRHQSPNWASPSGTIARSSRRLGTDSSNASSTSKVRIGLSRLPRPERRFRSRRVISSIARPQPAATASAAMKGKPHDLGPSRIERPEHKRGETCGATRPET